MPALLLCACVHRTPPQRLAQPAAAAATLLFDSAAGAGELPDEVEQGVLRELSSRNLDPRPQPPSALGGTRNTQQRLALLARTGDAPYVVLLETRVIYFDILQGRYRWVVYGRATVARKDNLQGAAQSEFELPVFLTYEHEKEPEALRTAAFALADRVGALLDNFLGAPTQAAPSPGQPSSRAGAINAPGALYFALVDRYANGDRANDGAIDLQDPQAFHGGDLQGVLQHLDELQSLGATALWLSPVFAMRTTKFFGSGAFHGYWTEDLNAVEPRFGSEELLRKLALALHARGMKLYLDLVLNHVAPEGMLLRAHPDWFHHQGSITDWNDPAQQESRDVSGLPDLAQENPQVYRYLLEASTRWAGIADGFRLDAVKHIPIAFWSRFNADLHARRPGFQLLGEALDGDAAHLARLQRAGGFDALFDFPLSFALVDVFCKDQPVGRLGAVLSLDRLYADAGSLVTLVDDHDLPRIAGACSGDLARVRQALLVQLLVRGTPLVTYGTESALAGVKEPENRADMDFAHQPLRELITGVLALRRAHPALSSGAETVLALDGEVLVLGRSGEGERVAIAINRGARPAELPLDWAGEEVLLAEPAPGEPGRRGPALIPARGALVLRRRTLVAAGAGGAAPGALPAAPREGLRALVFRGTAPIAAGDSLLLIGAGPELGSWDPALALPLVNEARIALPASTVAEFKLLIRRRDGTLDWEPVDDRFFFVPPGTGEIRLELTWRSSWHRSS